MHRLLLVWGPQGAWPFPSYGGQPVNDRKLLGIGLGGSVLAAACCFTTIPALLLGAIGLSAWLVWLDYIVFPALVLSLGIAAYALMRRYKA
jgi:mercuric ion transport protein